MEASSIHILFNSVVACDKIIHCHVFTFFLSVSDRINPGRDRKFKVEEYPRCHIRKFLPVKL